MVLCGCNQYTTLQGKSHTHSVTCVHDALWLHASRSAYNSILYDTCVMQRDFTVRIQSATPLSVSDVSASNGEVMSVTPVSGSTGSYDVAVAAKKSGVVAVSTLAAASTIDVNVDTDEPKVRHVDIRQSCPCCCCCCHLEVPSTRTVHCNMEPMDVIIVSTLLLPL